MTILEKKGGTFSVIHPFDELCIGIAARESAIDYSGSLPDIRSRERDFLSELTGIEGSDIVFLNQVHADGIIVMRERPRNETLVIGDADAIVTGIPGLCAVIRTADCVPVFLYHPAKKILAAVHSGWKGTLLRISARAASVMVSDFGCDPAGIHAYILPSIGPSSYQVHDDVAGHFPGYVAEIDGSLYLDLWRSITDSLVAAGISAANIRNSGICNLSGRSEFYTHRGGDTGRNLNFAYIRA